jgi:hypothetical protein
VNGVIKRERKKKRKPTIYLMSLHKMKGEKEESLSHASLKLIFGNSNFFTGFIPDRFVTLKLFSQNCFDVSVQITSAIQ